jgi:hypothetical protein
MDGVVIHRMCSTEGRPQKNKLSHSRVRWLQWHRGALRPTIGVRSSGLSGQAHLGGWARPCGAAARNSAAWAGHSEEWSDHAGSGGKEGQSNIPEPQESSHSSPSQSNAGLAGIFTSSRHVTAKLTNCKWTQSNDLLFALMTRFLIPCCRDLVKLTANLTEPGNYAKDLQQREMRGVKGSKHSI